jgi:hypothetical protein
MNRCIKILSCLLILLFISSKNKAAVNYIPFSPPADTSEKAVKKLSNKEAHKAAIMSTILPGLGQAYNKKYWKIPFVYAAITGMTILAITVGKNYEKYHKELQIRYQYGDSVNGYSKYSNEKLANLSDANVNTEKLLYQKRMDLCIIGVGFVYLLNIIDASIDGHFKTFDMSDNLSMTIKPKTFFCVQNPRSFGAGLSVALTFK